MLSLVQFLIKEFGGSGPVGGASSTANPFGQGGVNQLAAAPNEWTKDIEDQKQKELDDELHNLRWSLGKDNLRMPGTLAPRYDQLDLSLLDSEDEVLDKLDTGDYSCDEEEDIEYGIYDERIASDVFYHSSPGNLPYDALENPKRYIDDIHPVQRFEGEEDDVINLFHADGDYEKIAKEQFGGSNRAMALSYGYGGSIRKPKETINNNTLAAPKDFTQGHQSFPKQDNLPAGGMGYVATARKFVPDNYEQDSAMKVNEIIDEILDEQEYDEDEEKEELEYETKEIDERFLSDVEDLENQFEEAKSIDEYRNVINNISDTIQSYKISSTEYHVPLNILIGLFRLKEEAEEKVKEQQ